MPTDEIIRRLIEALMPTDEIMRRLIEAGEVERLRVKLAALTGLDLSDMSERSVVINAWTRGLHR